MSLKFTAYFAVGRTPSSAPDPWSGPSQNTQSGGRRGRRPRSRGTAPHADFLNALQRRDTSKLLKKAETRLRTRHPSGLLRIVVLQSPAILSSSNVLLAAAQNRDRSWAGRKESVRKKPFASLLGAGAGPGGGCRGTRGVIPLDDGRHLHHLHRADANRGFLETALDAGSHSVLHSLGERAQHNGAGLALQIAEKVYIARLGERNSQFPKMLRFAALEVLKDQSLEIHADALESKFAASGTDSDPALFNAGRTRQPLFELHQPGLKIDDAPESALQEHPAGHGEFGVTQLLNRHPGYRAKHDHNPTAELVAQRTGGQR